MDRDTSCTSIPALRDGSLPCSMNLGCFGDRLGPRPAFVRIAQGAPPAWDATAAPRLRVAAAKVDEGLLFPLAGDNVHARRVIPASRKILLVISERSTAAPGIRHSINSLPPLVVSHAVVPRPQ